MSNDYNTFTVGTPMPESTLTLCQSRICPPIRAFGFGIRSSNPVQIFMLIVQQYAFDSNDETATSYLECK
jgi:hypothetical protein